jgi:hypothetical protein
MFPQLLFHEDFNTSPPRLLQHMPIIGQEVPPVGGCRLSRMWLQP